MIVKWLLSLILTLITEYSRREIYKWLHVENKRNIVYLVDENKSNEDMQ
jgi:hypothetical protein